MINFNELHAIREEIIIRIYQSSVKVYLPLKTIVNLHQAKTMRYYCEKQACKCFSGMCVDTLSLIVDVTYRHCVGHVKTWRVDNASTISRWSTMSIIVVDNSKKIWLELRNNHGISSVVSNGNKNWNIRFLGKLCLLRKKYFH